MSRVHYWLGKREEREAFPCSLTLHPPGNGGGIQTSFTFGRHCCLLFLLLSRYFSPSPCCQSAPVFNFHQSPCRRFSPTTDKMKHNHRNIHFKNEKTRPNSPSNTPAPPTITLFIDLLPHFSNRTHRLGVILLLSRERGRITLRSYSANRAVCRLLGGM